GRSGRCGAFFASALPATSLAEAAALRSCLALGRLPLATRQASRPTRQKALSVSNLPAPSPPASDATFSARFATWAGRARPAVRFAAGRALALLPAGFAVLARAFPAPCLCLVARELPLR